ncbi:corrinoid protein [Sporomusa sphaeroides]|uniref:Methionine synthase n=1 Tax=Sporomusa sphaeroides DSM 2875 TaxID=1337886 RepID=A0ABM9VZS8_9FIRM|nr:corrinoid protein [Sporomusa sphaeroides]MCM0759722.1 corrinoid protein [Sporomusa sphaeroides DSM 2875]OLS57326.1 methionine synthase [Sporomusa sphaeroides DSM 2875]CVK18116.1 Methionine synthase [Sporomusa sphaeroides DSM 2875]
MTGKEELLKLLAACVVEMEDEKIIPTAQAYIKAGYPAAEGILHGLVEGMNKAADLYENEEYFIPELLICSDAMYNGLDVLSPHLGKHDFQKKAKVVIGVVEGDTHDIGKNIVKIMLETAGYEIIDLGRDVPAAAFIECVKNTGASVVALATLMSTSTGNMKKVIDLLQQAGLREGVKVIVGGGPISAAFAEKIGADGYAVNAVEAVKLADRLVG